MANFLNVRRVQIQEIDKRGRPIGKPSYGILASDDYEQQFTDAYSSVKELNAAIREAGSIIAVVGGFDTLDLSEVGFDNYAGSARSRLDPT